MTKAPSVSGGASWSAMRRERQRMARPSGPGEELDFRALAMAAHVMGEP